MDLNDMFRSLRLEDGDGQNLALDSVRGFYKLHPDLPEPAVETMISEPLLEDIIRKHLSSQPIRRFFELRVVCKHLQAFLTVPKLLQAHPVPESWMLKQNCVRRVDNTVTLDTYDVLQKKPLLLPVPTHIASCQGQPGLISTDELRVSSSQGGESGLVYLEKSGDSTSDSRRTREYFVFNPMTKSARQLRLDCSVRQVDRFNSGYLSWASNHGEEMFPLLLDPLTNTWNRIGSDFTTRGPIRKEKAVVNEVVYLRYQGRRLELKDQLIIYDTLHKTFREESTTGLPDNMVDEHLFHHEGHIYLAAVAVVLGQSTALKRVLLYEFKSSSSELIWEIVSEIPARLLHELINPYPAVTKLKFFYVEHELLVASFVTKRRSDGAHVFVDGAGSRCLAIAAYDLTSHSWRKEEAGRLGPELHINTMVFRPRLDIEA